jgi:four helix bundle protein
LGYKDLLAWSKSRDLAIEVFRLTERAPLRQKRALCDQMQRAALSVPSNIAEGEERGGNKEALRFLYIAKGSLAELRTQADIGHAAEFITKEEFSRLESSADHIARLLSGLIKNRLLRERAQNPPP